MLAAITIIITIVTIIIVIIYKMAERSTEHRAREYRNSDAPYGEGMKSYDTLKSTVSIRRKEYNSG